MLQRFGQCIANYRSMRELEQLPVLFLAAAILAAGARRRIQMHDQRRRRITQSRAGEYSRSES
jgi:hypothetical protein